MRALGSDQVAGFAPEQVRVLSGEQFGSLSSGALAGLNEGLMGALTSVQAAGFGTAQVRGLRGEQKSAYGYIWKYEGGLS